MNGDIEKKAAEFIRDIPLSSKVVILYHGDADGVCSAVMIYKCLHYLGILNLFPIPLGRGENPFSKNTFEMLQKKTPDFLIILDSGSRKGSTGNIKCLIIDHHVPDVIPEVDVFFNTWLDKSNRITSEAVLDLVEGFISINDLQWYALAGAAADAGISRISGKFSDSVNKYKSKIIQECISLINAARRHSSFKIAEIFNLLISSSSPSQFIDVAKSAGMGILKAEVNRDLKKNLKIAPEFHDIFALFQVKSPHQIHPLIATIWSAKLKGYVVIAANWSYLPGMVSFSVRSESEIDLLELLRKYRQPGEEIGFGHSKATGGIVKEEVFRDFLQRLGFK